MYLCIESVGDTSDDEPLSKLLKPGKKCSEDIRKTEAVSHAVIHLIIVSFFNLL